MTNDERVVAVTPLGALRGVRAGNVSIFRGVRFAQSPSGELRFAPPLPVEPWEGIRDATHDGPTPPQLGTPASGATRIDEDCLSLTIWTPAPDGRQRPVMLWIFGGGFMVGAGSIPFYDGANLAQHDVVVVNINYRLGVLGYLCQSGVSPGNLGLLDQSLALKWVRSNIRAFGGDPDNITIAGQSAGALSAAYLTALPEAKGMVRRVILQSPAFDTGLPTRAENEAVAAQLMQELGLVATSAAETRRQMLAMPVGKILAAQKAIADRSWRGREGLVRRPFFPSLVPPLDMGERQVLDVLADAIVAGGMELLIGTTRDDAAHFYGSDPEVWNMDEQMLLRRIAGILPGDPVPRLAHIRKLKPAASFAECLVNLVTDFQLRLSALQLADDVSDRGGQVYFYRFDWFGNDASWGASHCAEVPFVFGTMKDWTDWPFMRGADGAKASRMAEIMQAAWINFLRFGNPSGPGSTQWPRYHKQDRQVMVLDLEPRAAIAEPPYYVK